MSGGHAHQSFMPAPELRAGGSARGGGLPPAYDPTAPVIATTAVPNCPVCSGSEQSHWASGFDYEMETCANEWRFVRCGDCGCVWLNPRPADDALGVIYPPTYYSYDLEKRISPIAVRAKRLLDGRKFGWLLRSMPAQPRSYLDIGCGDGRYLGYFARRGLPANKLYGLELSETAVERLRGAGYQVHCRRVEDCTEIPPGEIDLATMFHVIEHVADPQEVLRRIARWLSPGGCLAVETPNVHSLDARLFKDKWWGGYHIPRHWTLFDETTLRRLLTGAGLEVVGFRYQTGHSFWAYSFHHWLRYNDRRPRPGLARAFHPHKSLPSLAMFTGIDMLRRSFRIPTSSILMIARKS